MERNSKKLLTEIEVEITYGITRHWLRRKRVEGGGPEFFKIGRNVRYSAEKIEAFISGSQQSSTSAFSQR